MTLQCGDESDDDGDKDLHAEESKDEDEEEEEEEEGEDGGDGVHQRHHQVPQRGPVPVQEVPLTVLSVIHQTVSQRGKNRKAYFVTLNTLSSLRALRAESPKEPARSRT